VAITKEEMKALIERHIDSRLKCGDAIESLECGDAVEPANPKQRDSTTFWNYLLMVNGGAMAIGSIDYVPINQTVRVNPYSRCPISLGESYGCDLKQILQNKIHERGSLIE